MTWNDYPVDKWKRDFEWTTYNVQPGYPAFKQLPKQLYNETFVLDTHFLTFNWSKYLCGVTFKYVHETDDIYKIDEIVSDDNYSLLNYFNPYDVIKEHYSNIHPVDIACDFNVFTSFNQYTLDGVRLKSGNRVLLFGNENARDNGIYQVNENFKLIRTDDLNSGNTYRYQVYCKTGTYRNKHLYLVPDEFGIFPSDGDRITFRVNRGLILKNTVNYDIFNTGQTNDTASKIVFTDVDVARKQLDVNANLYEGIELIGSDVNSLTPFVIKYTDIEYVIRASSIIDYEDEFYDNGFNIYNQSGKTFVKVSSGFPKVSGDMVELDITYNSITNPFVDNSYATIKTFIDEQINSTTITLTDFIPNYILDIIGANFSGYTTSLLSGSTIYDFKELYSTQFIYDDGWNLTGYFDINTSTQQLQLDVTGSTNSTASQYLWSKTSSGSTCKIGFSISDLDIALPISGTCTLSGSSSTQQIVDFSGFTNGYHEVWFTSNDIFDSFIIEFNSTNVTGISFNSISFNQVENISYADSGLTLYYNMNELTGITQNIVIDSIGSNSTTGYSLSIEEGIYDNCFGYNGESSYIRLPDSLITNNKTFSLSVWFKTSNPGPILGYQNATVNNICTRWVPAIYIGNDGKLRCQVWDGRATPITSNNRVDDGMWHNVILSAYESGQTAYLDTTNIGTKNRNINHLDMTFGQLGAAYTRYWPEGPDKLGWSYFDGLIDEFGYWDRVLNKDERDYIFNLGKGSTYYSDSIIFESDADEYDYKIRNLNYSDLQINNFIRSINDSLFGPYLRADVELLGTNVSVSDNNIISFLDGTYATPFDTFISTRNGDFSFAFGDYDGVDPVFLSFDNQNIVFTGITSGVSFHEFYSNRFDATEGERFELNLIISGVTTDGDSLIFTHSSTFSGFDSGLTTNIISESYLSGDTISYYDFESNIDKISSGALYNYNVKSTTGIIRQAYNYNGNNALSKLPDDYINQSLSGFSISLWFKTSSYGVILGQQDVEYPEDATSIYNPLLYVGIDGKLRSSLYNALINNDSLIDDDEWHNAILTVDYYKQRLYVDNNKKEYTYRWNINNFSSLSDWQFENNDEGWDFYTTSTSQPAYSATSTYVEFKSDTPITQGESGNITWTNSGNTNITLNITADLMAKNRGRIQVHIDNSLIYILNNPTYSGTVYDNWVNSGFTIPPGSTFKISTSNGGSVVGESYIRIKSIIYGDTLPQTNTMKYNQLGTGLGSGKEALPTNNYFYFKGSIDELSYWDKTLTDSEVDFIYNNTLGSTYNNINSEPYIRSQFRSTQNSTITIKSNTFDVLGNYWYKVDLSIIDFLNISNIEISLVDLNGNRNSIIKSEDDSFLGNTFNYTSIDFDNTDTPSVIFESINSGTCYLQYKITPIDIVSDKRLTMSVDLYEYHSMTLEFDIRNKDRERISENSVVIPGEIGVYTGNTLKIINDLPSAVVDAYLFCDINVMGSPIFSKSIIGVLDLSRIIEDFKITLSPEHNVEDRYFYYDEFKFYTEKEYLLTESGSTTSIMSTETGTTLNPVESKLIILEESGTEVRSFNTYNNYINYKLQPFLYRIWTGFTEDYEICDSYGLSDSNFTWEFYQTNSSKTFIVYPDDINVLSNFEKYTYVRFSGSTFYSMILSIGEDYMILEVPKDYLSFMSLSDYSFEIANKLGEISMILYDQSIRYSTTIAINDYHINKRVSNAYGKCLQANEDIQNYTTGIIYGNDKNKYIFKIFDKDDEKLSYNPVEISVIGVEGKYRFPITLENENFINED